MFTIACCSVIGLGLGLGLDLVSGWLVVMHTYFTIFGCHCHTAMQKYDTFHTPLPPDEFCFCWLLGLTD